MRRRMAREAVEGKMGKGTLYAVCGSLMLEYVQKQRGCTVIGQVLHAVRLQKVQHVKVPRLVLTLAGRLPRMFAERIHALCAHAAASA